MATQQIKENLHFYTLKRDWKNVIEIFKEHPEFYGTKITTSHDTALHVAATDGARDSTLVQLLDAMEETDKEATKNALKAKDKQGDTPLHCAATRTCLTSLRMCERIINIVPSLVGDRNNKRETPLFLAALHGNKQTFLYLHSVTSKLFESTTSPPWRRNGGETILHCTIQREYFDLAFCIIHLYKDQNIVASVDEKGITPLHVLASKPSAFESGTRLRWWTKILYHYMVVEPMKVPDTALTQSKVDVEVEQTEPPHNQSEVSHTWATHKDKEKTTLFDKDKLREILCLNAGLGSMHIKKIKQKHEWCAQIVDALVGTDEYLFLDGREPFIDRSDEEQENFVKAGKEAKTNSSHLTNSNGEQQKKQESSTSKQDAQPKEKGETLEALLIKLLKLKQDAQKEEMPKTMTALLVAAKNGSIELVKRILENKPGAIRERTEDDKSILHVAVENRQPYILTELKNHVAWDSLIETVDAKGNNVLHLAAEVSKNEPWKIPGSAMQMQWEIKWYQFVKQNVPQHLIFQTNKDGVTPGEIFIKSHEQLVKEASNWLKSTSSSCSVVAALIAGASFATSSQVPGGNDDKTGEPTLEGKPAFSIFAISTLVALSFSITALVMFLSILTSRQQQKDFRRGLPFKLLLGLSSLFVSIASILVSFGSAYFFVLKNQLSIGIYIIYATICLPVSFYAFVQFPLYLDLLKANLKKLPEPSFNDDDL